ncbi:hypothetical protein [Miniphocaeibacter massiliensis]|uniref:hypothetical protein n=1 Tax=Miniphocaeibacter massiliensis TaxID=2041841 RepID=UPI000C08BC89|nr:hypothetical protein [Miniphocaeibacter massiliensis]
MIKKIYILSLVSILTLFICTSCTDYNKNNSSTSIVFNPTPQFDYEYFNSLEEMKNASNLIIKGSIISDDGIHEIKLTPGEEYETEIKYHLYTIKIDETIETSNYTNKTVQIKIPSSEDIDSKFSIGTNGIFFLETYENFPASLINLDQSYLKIEKDKVQLDENTKELLPINDKSNEVPVDNVIEKIQE